MKQVATAIPYGLCKMFLDETEDSSRLIKVANGACCFHQVRIDYEAMLLKKFWKCYKQCDHTRKITLGWSALPKLDEDGGMYVENLSNNQSITIITWYFIFFTIWNICIIKPYCFITTRACYRF